MLFVMTAEWSAAALKSLIQNPVDRSQAAKQTAEAAGGRLVAWYGTSGGDHQGLMAIVDVPDGVTMQAMYNAGRASGALETIKIQRLYTPAETVEAFQKAQSIQKAYSPPA